MGDAETPLDTHSGGLPPWGWGADLCAPFVAQLPVTGASISVFGLTGRQLALCSSDPVAARLEELHFNLGEGPHWIVARTGRSVISADLANDPHPDWPIFAAECAALEVGALFAFPVRMGAVTVGVVDLYRTLPGDLEATDLSRARSLARTVAAPAVQAAIRSANDETTAEVRGDPAIRREVHQAVGMILIQLETTATEAFSLLRAHAFAAGRSVDEVARDVVARRLDFSDLLP
jgi:GAF domain-containing protein